MSPAPLGYVLGGRFDLVEVISEGGTSTVYRAVDRIGLWAREQNPEVAVKVIQPHSAHTGEGDHADRRMETA